MPLHHIELNVSDLDRSYDFYARLAAFLGLEIERGSAYFQINDPPYYIFVNPTAADRAAHGFDRYRIGLNHLAFRVESQAQVDAWHAEISARDVTVLDPPGFYGPEYYAVYFEDPDGMKLEIGAEAKPTGG